MPGRYRQTTSLEIGQPDGSPFDGVRKAITVSAGSTVSLARLSGAGRIVRFWLTLPLVGQRAALKNIALRMFWDGELEPSVEAPLGDFFGASFGKPRTLISKFFTILGGGYLCRMVMPFNSGARIELRNDGPIPIKSVFYQLAYLDEPERTAPEPTLHAQYRRVVSSEGSGPIELVHAIGKGRFAGLCLNVENRSWWLKPPWALIALPRGFGLGLLEGWETIIVDDDVEGALVGTGAEDYFSSGFYFKGAPFCAPMHGCTFRSFLQGRASAYRFYDEHDAIHFDDSFAFLLDHGLKNQMAGVYDSTVYWYQSEPHASFPSMPTLAERRQRTPWSNPMQWLLLFVGFCGLATLVVYVVAR